MAIVVGLYEEFSSAHRVVRVLLENNIDQDNISLIASDEEKRATQYLSQMKRDSDESGAADGDESAELGASIGAVIGGMGGLLAGLGALVIPVVGPILAVGPIAAAISGLAGAGVGALAGGAAGGLIGALVEVGVPPETASLYAEGVRRGGTLVVVRAPDDQEEQVREIVERFQPIDIGKLEEQENASIFPPLDQVMESHEINPEKREELLASPFTQEVPPEHSQPGFLYGYSHAASAEYAGRSWAEALPDLKREWTSYDYGPWPVYEAAVRNGYQQGQLRADEEFRPVEGEFRQHFQQHRPRRRAEYDQFQPSYRFGWDMARQVNGSPAGWEEASQEVERAWHELYGEGWDLHREAVRFAWEYQRGGERGNRPGQEHSQDADAAFEEHFKAHPTEEKFGFEEIRPAYTLGHELARQHSSGTERWAGMEAAARQAWGEDRELPWDKVRDYVQYAWERARSVLQNQATSGNQNKEQEE